MSMSGEGGRPPFGPGARAQQDDRERNSGREAARRPTIDQLRDRRATGQQGVGPAYEPQGEQPFGAPPAGGPLPGLAAFGRMAGVAPPQAQGGQEFNPEFDPVRPGPRVLTRDADARTQSDLPPHLPRQYEDTPDAPGYAAFDETAETGAGFEPEEAAEFGRPDDGADDLGSGLPAELRRYLKPDDDDDGVSHEDLDGAPDPRAEGSEDFGTEADRRGFTPAFAGYDASLGEDEEATSVHAFENPADEDPVSAADTFEPLDLGREHLMDDDPDDYATFADDADDALHADAHDGAGPGLYNGLHDRLRHQEYDHDGVQDDLDEDRGGHFSEDPHEAGMDGRGLSAFEARYDRHPEIPIGAFPAADGEEPLEQGMFLDDDSDAEFLDSGFPGAPAEADRPRRGRKLLMVGCGLIGAVALGGALAFAYKTGGDSIAGSGQPPIIQADAEPVKTAPADPGGREFPDRNKEVYERLQGEENARQSEERLLPRQEEAAPSGPLQTGAIGGEREPANDQVGAAPSNAQQAAPTETERTAPRRVRTFVVRPDGSVVQPSEAESPQRTASLNQQGQQSQQDQVSVPGMSVVMPGSQQQQQQQQGTGAPSAQERLPQQQQQQPLASPQQQQGAPSQAEPPAQAAGPRQPGQQQQLQQLQPQQEEQQPAQQAAPSEQAQQPQQAEQPEAQIASLPQSATGSVQPPNRRPEPPPSSAARQPASGASQSADSFVVQVAAHRSQTEALAAFADLQQRYPDQLQNYRPIIERADLQDRGVFYRLRVGPMDTRQTAGNLCEQLKSAGLQSCLVYAQ